MIEKNVDLEFESYKFASIKHKNQLDDEGLPYFMVHIIPVVNILEQITTDKEIIAAAYLHDTLEDTDTTYEELEENFGKIIADLVLELTHKGNKTEGYTFPRLKSKKAIIIKFADRLSNLSRMNGWDKKRQEHYMNKSRFWKL